MPVNTKRVKEVKDSIVSILRLNEVIDGAALNLTLSMLPEFQSLEWIRCSERMPERNQKVLWWNGYSVDRTGICYNKVTAQQQYSHWLPYIEPAPPVEEESELVKELREYLKGTCIGDDELLIKLVKRHEKRGRNEL